MDFYPTSLYLARNGPGWVGILPPVSRCCDSKELEINLSYNHFFCGPRPTTNINQISSFRALSLRAFTRSLGPFPPLSVAVCRLFLFLPFGPPAHCTCIYIQEHPSESPLSFLIFVARSHEVTDCLSSSLARHVPNRPWSIKEARGRPDRGYLLSI